MKDYFYDKFLKINISKDGYVIQRKKFIPSGELVEYSKGDYYFKNKKIFATGEEALIFDAIYNQATIEIIKMSEDDGALYRADFRKIKLPFEEMGINPNSLIRSLGENGTYANGFIYWKAIYSDRSSTFNGILGYDIKNDKCYILAKLYGNNQIKTSSVISYNGNVYLIYSDKYKNTKAFKLDTHFENGVVVGELNDTTDLGDIPFTIPDNNKQDIYQTGKYLVKVSESEPDCFSPSKLKTTIYVFDGREWRIVTGVFSSDKKYNIYSAIVNNGLICTGRNVENKGDCYYFDVRTKKLVSSGFRLNQEELKNQYDNACLIPIKDKVYYVAYGDGGCVWTALNVDSGFVKVELDKNDDIEVSGEGYYCPGNRVELEFKPKEGVNIYGISINGNDLEFIPDSLSYKYVTDTYGVLNGIEIKVNYEKEEPTTEAEPTTEVEPTTEAEPTTEVEPTTEAEPTTEVEPATEAEPTTVVEPTTEAEPTTVVEPTTKAEPTTVVEPATKAEPTTVVEPATKTEPTTVLEPATKAEPTTVVEPATKAEPTTVVEPITKNEVTTKDGSEKIGRVVIKKIYRRKAKAKITVKKIHNAFRYEVLYSKKRKFTKKTTRRFKVKYTRFVIKKLKQGQKYYIRVRALVYISGKLKRGKWSKTKEIKIK